MDAIILTNLILCVIIVILATMAYLKKKVKLPLYIGAGFGLFGISHLATLLEINDGISDILLIVRLVGYILVVVALLTLVWEKMPAKIR